MHNPNGPRIDKDLALAWPLNAFASPVHHPPQRADSVGSAQCTQVTLVPAPRYRAKTPTSLCLQCCVDSSEQNTSFVVCIFSSCSLNKGSCVDEVLADNPSSPGTGCVLGKEY